MSHHPPRIVALVALLGCTRSTPAPTETVDCGGGERVVVVSSPFCVYADGAAPAACPPQLPHLADYEGTPLCGQEERADPRLLEAAVAAAFEKIDVRPRDAGRPSILDARVLDVRDAGRLTR